MAPVSALSWGTKGRQVFLWAKSGRKQAIPSLGQALQDFHFNPDGLAFTLSTLRKPGGKAFGKTLWGQPKTRFQTAVGNWQGVVKVRGVGEISHRELIKPFKGTSTTLAADQDVNLEFLRVHLELE